MARREPDFEAIRAWQRIARDTLIVGIGAFMLLYETVGARIPDPYLIGAGLVALGVPPALRFDERRRNGDDAPPSP